jgi:hypothetical protein
MKNPAKIRNPKSRVHIDLAVTLPILVPVLPPVPVPD